jgi:hypothetical protein
MRPSQLQGHSWALSLVDPGGARACVPEVSVGVRCRVDSATPSPLAPHAVARPSQDNLSVRSNRGLRVTYLCQLT